jgi:DNA-binding transcriptional LysR family regulator
MQMEIRLLKYFLMVAAEQNITRAAKQLNITQPTLSRQIKEFEEYLGTDLFIRKNKKMYLTDSGFFLKERAKEIIALNDKTEQEFINNKNTLLSGHLAIGCVEATNSEFLATMIKEMVLAHPQVTYTIFSGTSEDIIEKLDKGLLDVAILIEPTAIEKYEKITLPEKETWGVLVAAEHPLACQTAATAEDIQELSLFSSNRNEVLAMITAWAKCTLEDLTIIGRYNLIFNVISLVEQEIGAALAISGAIKNRNSTMTKFLPFSPTLETSCVLVWKKNTLLSTTVHTFIQQTKHALKAYNAV